MTRRRPLGFALIILTASMFLIGAVPTKAVPRSSSGTYSSISLAGSDSHPNTESNNLPGVQLYPQDPLLGGQLDTPDMEKGFLSVFTTSSEAYTVPVSSFGTITSISLNQSTSIFISDARGGDKLDILLRNYTMLFHEEYLRDGKIGVIILLGEMVRHDTYAVHQISQSEITSLSNKIQQFEGEVNSAYSCFPLLEVELPYEKVFELENENSVAHVFLNKKHSVQLADSVPIIKPPETWMQVEAYFGFEINGTGVKIAILDTGVDMNHPDLDDLDDNHTTYDPKVVAEECFTDEGHVWDGFGHGTHCASIAAGTGEASNYTHVGVAPGAFLLNGKVLTDAGWGYDSWIIRGIEWAVNNSANVISMSFGANINGDGTDPLSMAVDWATSQGATCVVAAGNSGSGGMFTVGIPAVSRTTIAVGATTKTDEVIYFSSQGPTSDYRLKPDVCAPGVDIVAARASGTSMGTPINGHYTRASGTSMATPHVAGAAALLLQAHTGWNSTLVKSAMMGNAEPLSDELVWRQGAGRINVWKSLNTTLLVVEPSSSFIMPGLGEIVNTTLTLMNLANTSASVDMSAVTFCEGNEAAYVSTNVTSLAIPAYDSINFEVHVGPLDDEAPEGWYEGWLNITSSQGSIRAPYFFVALSTVTVNVYDEDNVTPIEAMIVLATYPKMSFVDFAETSYHGAQYEAARLTSKSGEYALCAQMAWIDSGSWPPDFTRMFMIEKVISVPKLSTISISISLAEAKVSLIPTIASSGSNLTVHSYMQYYCGGHQKWYKDYFQQSEWSLGSGWFGFDHNISHLTLYSSEYTPPDRLCEALGYYASDALHSEVYMMPFKFWNVTSLPDTIGYQESDVARYDVFYDMPETYPENGLNIMNAFWFTWDHIGTFQIWGWDVHTVNAGINATYYLAPGNGTYFGNYMATYEGWTNYLYGPIQEWSIGRHYPYPQTALRKSETGNRIIGNTSFAPYQPDLDLNVSSSGTIFKVDLTGDVWSNLSWPHWQWAMISPLQGPLSPYPQHYAKFKVYVDQTLFDEGELNGKNGYNGESYIRYPPYHLDVDWCGIYETWDIAGRNVLIQLTLPSMATISRHTVYSMSFTLGEEDSTPPIITGISYPLNYTPGEDLRLNFTTSDVGLGIKSHFLKYSFNNGTSWQDAFYEEPYYVIPCEEADSLAILINVTDDSGNSLQYFSSPVALSRKVNLSVPDQSPAHAEESVEVAGNLTTVEGKSIHGVAVTLSNNDTAYTSSNTDGAFTFTLDAPIANDDYSVTSPSVGLYCSARIPLTPMRGEATYVVIDQAIVSKERCDVGTTQAVWMHAKWAGNDSNVVGGSIYLNSTEYVTNQTGWIGLNVTQTAVGKRAWNVMGVYCRGITTYENQYSTPYIIWDRIRITDGGVSRTQTNVTQTETVWFRGVYEFDGVIFNETTGNLYVNGSAMTWSSTDKRWEHNCTLNTAGTRTFKVSSVSDNLYGLIAIEDAVGPLSIEWVEHSNPPSTPVVISPDGGEVWSDPRNLTWTASTDPDGDPIAYQVEYSNDSGSTWCLIISDVSETRFEWDTTKHPDGVEYLVRVRAFDGSLYSDWDVSDSVFAIANAFPSIVDCAPAGTHVPIGTAVTITFSKLMNQTSVEEAFSTSPTIAGSFTWGSNTVTFTPDTALEYGATYNLTISTEAKDAVVKSLQATFNWHFTTIAAPAAPAPSAPPAPPPSPPALPPPPPSVVDIDLTIVSRRRCDVGSTQAVYFHAVLNGENVVEGTLYVNGTAYVINATGWISFEYNSKIACRRTWVVTGVSCGNVTTFEQSASNPRIIWDRIAIVEGGVFNTLTNVTMTETVWYRAIREYDGTLFGGTDGALCLNGLVMVWNPANLRWEANVTFNTAGTRTFKVSDASDIRYGLTALNDAVGSLSINWVESKATSEGVNYMIPVTSYGETNKIPVTTNSTISNFSVDAAARQVNLTLSGPTGTTGKSNVTIPKQLLDGYDLQVYLDGEPYPCTLTENDTCYFVYIEYIHSQHYINIRFRDLTPPSLSIIFPFEDAQLNFSSFTAIWNGSDTASGMDHYQVRLDVEDWTSCGYNTFHGFQALSAGGYIVHVKAVDRVGNVREASVCFVVDLAPPNLSIISPASDTTVESSNLALNWSCSDDTSGIDHYEVKLDTGSWIITGNETSYTFYEVDDGYHTMHVKAIDNTGNSIEEKVSLEVDTSVPLINIGEFGSVDGGLISVAIIILIALSSVGIVVSRNWHRKSLYRARDRELVCL